MGPQGPQGVPPNQANVSTILSNTYTYVALGVDSHHIMGYLVNFGNKAANNVIISMSWTVGGVMVSQNYNYGPMPGYSFRTVDVTYSFDNNGPFTYSVSWS